MTERIFRGKIKTDNGDYHKGEWVYGDLVNLQDGERKIPYIYGKGEIIPDSAGQYIGLPDKNGTLIFEGDILEVFYNPHYIGISADRVGVFEVVFSGGCFMKRNPNKVGLFHFISTDECKVIGNVHDNPELLKGGAE